MEQTRCKSAAFEADQCPARRKLGSYLRNRQKAAAVLRPWPPYLHGAYSQDVAPGARRGKSGVVVPGKGRFEISAATKARVLEVCRCFDEWRWGAGCSQIGFWSLASAAVGADARGAELTWCLQKLNFATPAPD